MQSYLCIYFFLNPRGLLVFKFSSSIPLYGVAYIITWTVWISSDLTSAVAFTELRSRGSAHWQSFLRGWKKRHVCLPPFWTSIGHIRLPGMWPPLELRNMQYDTWYSFSAAQASAGHCPQPATQSGGWRADPPPELRCSTMLLCRGGISITFLTEEFF